MVEAVLSDGRHISNHCEGCESVSNKGLQTLCWVHDGLLLSMNEFFPESNYLLYKNISAVEWFEKFFDEEVLELIVTQMILYAMCKGDIGFTVTAKKTHVFLGILIVSGIPQSLQSNAIGITPR